MHLRAAVSIALLACASHVASTAKPYKLAMMPIDGISLMRRDKPRYQPSQTNCNKGKTCADACGEGYITCPSQDETLHCFNPTKGETCCTDVLGNSCRKGYYCTQDSTLKTWCCPDEMDLAECAIAYSITGKLKTPEATTNTPMPSPTSTTVVSPLTTSIPVTIVPTTSIAAVPPEATGAANPLGASALILAAAGVLALF